MKKLALVLVVLLIAFAPLFAEESNMKVSKTVAPITEVGFSMTKYETESESITPIGDTVKTLSDTGSTTFYVAVRTNSKNAVTITLTNTPLVNQDDSTQTVELLCNGARHLPDIDTPLEILKEEGTDRGLRALSEAFTLSYSTTALASATAGEYQATVYMQVTGE